LVVIINADDLGMNQRVNREIFRLIDAGAVTSATMLANGAAIEEAAVEARAFPRCSFGVHLNLTEFKPLTTESGLRAILDDEGRFRGNHIRGIHIDARLKEAIFREWCAQIERLLALGITPSHIDSHHHTHTIPALLALLRRVREKFSIRKVRISRNVYAAGEPFVLKLKKSVYNAALRHVAGFKTTDRFSGLDMFIAAEGAASQSARSVELMVHPGATGSEQEAHLLGDWLENRGKHIRLINYSDL
jgi:predicted glycoside hydrolase/deacetylase ChbG (UPF0249 family)